MLKKTTLSFKMKESSVSLVKMSNEKKAGLPLFFFPSSHAIEEALISFVKKEGGAYFHFQTDNAFIRFTLEGYRWTCDPRFIFTRQGIENTLKANNPHPPNISEFILKSVEELATWFIGTLLFKENLFEVSFDAASPKSSSVSLTTTHKQTELFLRYADFRTKRPQKQEGTLEVALPLKNLHPITLDTNAAYKEIVLPLRFLRELKIPPPPTSWPFLREGDTVDIVAPSSHYSHPSGLYATIRKIFHKAGLKVTFTYAEQGPSPLGYSNTDEKRASFLYEALSREGSQAVLFIRGGAGASRLLPSLLKRGAPGVVKPLIGFSDADGVHHLITGLWNRVGVHGVMASLNKEIADSGLMHFNTNKKESLEHLLHALKRENTPKEILTYTGLKRLPSAQENAPTTLSTTILGGTITLVQPFIDAPFKSVYKPFTLFLGEVGETPTAYERLLDAIRYSQALQNCHAVLLGYISTTNTPYDLVRRRFSSRLSLPVFYTPHFGHGPYNHPLPLNTQATIELGADRSYTLSVHVR